jgi:hypothetical protein
MFELDELELFPKSSRTVRFANCSTHLYKLNGMIATGASTGGITDKPERKKERKKERSKQNSG